jgi:uncharacterized cupredoxin-like copper-binding protein
MSSRVSLRSLCLVSFALAALVLAACGSSDDNSSSSSSKTTSTKKPAAAAPSSGGSTVKFTAEDTNGLKFDKKTATAKAGTVTLAMDNPSGNSQQHAIAVEGNGVDKDGTPVQPGAGPSKVSVKLKPGKYEFYCPVDGHKQAGMEGTLTVN